MIWEAWVVWVLIGGFHLQCGGGVFDWWHGGEFSVDL